MSTASFEQITPEQVRQEIAREQERRHRKLRAPDATVAFGEIGPHDFAEFPEGPSFEEIADRPLADAAGEVEDPWAEASPAFFVEGNSV